MNKKYRNLMKIFSLFWLVLIFSFSHQTGVESKKQSTFLINKINIKREIKRTNIRMDKNTIVRKTAHFFLYFVLVFLFIFSKNKKDYIFIFVLIIIAAIFDEFHQSFIAGRSAKKMDVFIDSIGGLTGILFFIVFNFLYNKKQKSIK